MKKNNYNLRVSYTEHGDERVYVEFYLHPENQRLYIGVGQGEEEYFGGRIDYEAARALLRVALGEVGPPLLEYSYDDVFINVKVESGRKASIVFLSARSES